MDIPESGRYLIEYGFSLGFMIAVNRVQLSFVFDEPPPEPLERFRQVLNSQESHARHNSANSVSLRSMAMLSSRPRITTYKGIESAARIRNRRAAIQRF
jgi:hypothetical protein